jgi:hypothetical protein
MRRQVNQHRSDHNRRKLLSMFHFYNSMPWTPWRREINVARYSIACMGFMRSDPLIQTTRSLKALDSTLGLNTGTELKQLPGINPDDRFVAFQCREPFGSDRVQALPKQRTDADNATDSRFLNSYAIGSKRVSNPKSLVGSVANKNPLILQLLFPTFRIGGVFVEASQFLSRQRQRTYINGQQHSTGKA